ncbi:unnamed protein product [Lactuca saligna]|uniref:Uncharacterized protein n=1 Tax=Lactuca saligna TaxID=75948 RepID=A0AA35ZD26_LACSI|nr:unnamed protein product [Lactuca saligna]
MGMQQLQDNLCSVANKVLTIFTGALLEKQIVFVCSNLVLQNDMVDFLDAPVPFAVGVKHKTDEAQSKLANVIFANANKNQLGLVIDLINMSRYYSMNDWKKEGIKYVMVESRRKKTTSRLEQQLAE